MRRQVCAECGGLSVDGFETGPRCGSCERLMQFAVPEPRRVPDPPTAEQLERETDQSLRDELAELRAQVEETLSEIERAVRDSRRYRGGAT